MGDNRTSMDERVPVSNDELKDDAIRMLLDAARNSGDVDTARACYAALSNSEISNSSWTKDAARRHCAGAIRMFIAGAQECREMMARFVEGAGDVITAISIRANWNPTWGADPGKPTQAPEPYRCNGGAP